MRHEQNYLLKCILFIVTIFFWISWLSAAYTFETWTVEEGLPQNSVLCLLQDKTGYIWFGTQSGLVRFDGVSSRVYNRWNTPHLNGDQVTALYEDNAGVLWVGTENDGLCCLKNNEWTSYTIKEGLADNSIRALYGDREANLWIGTANGLNLLAPGKDKFEILTPGNDSWGNSITVITGGNNDSTVWIGTNDNGLYCISNGKYRPYDAGGDSIGSGITALCEDRDGAGGLWIGTQNGLFLLENGKIRRPVPATHPLFNNTVRSLLLDRNGTLWVGTDGEGIFQYRDNVFSIIPFSHEDYIYSFLEDREANIWVGTFTGGLTRLTGSRVTSVTMGSGLPQNLGRVLLADRNGGIWMGMDRKGLVKITDNKITGDVFPIDGITALYQDGQDNLWLGTQNNGIMCYVGDNFRAAAGIYTTREGLSNNRVTAIRGDRSGNIWIGTVNGLNKFEKGKFTVYTYEKNKAALHIKTIEIEENSSLSTVWLGTTQGLLRLRGDQLEDVLIPENGNGDGEGDGHGLPAADIQSLYADRRGRLWIGTNGGGLGRFSPEGLYLYNTGVGLPNNYIFSILEDNQNNLWLSSYKGVFRLAIDQLDQLAQKEIQALTPLYLDEKDGMASSECVKDGQPSACKTTAGKLYFPTVKGVTVIEPALIKRNNTLPPVIIEDVLMNNEPVTGRVNPVFPPGKNMLEFYFTALSFTAPGRVKLRYRMEGFEPRWIEVTPRGKRAALYVNLGPGNYRFMVTACNSDGLWNEKGATFEFKIKYPFYEHPLFYFLIITIFVALIGGAFLWYRKKMLPAVKVVKEINEIKDKPEEPKYKTSALLPGTVEEVLPRLLQLMEKEKIFLKADINLKSLAQRLNVHYNYLSQIINERLNHNFNDFINSYRIAEAKKKLLDPAHSDKTILDIAYDTGFYSKSVFNTAFKKFTGMTPSEFKRDKNKKTS